MDGKLTGLSLSFCVIDIVLGRVSLEQVEKIVTSTTAYGKAGWEEVLAEYKKSSWRGFPEEADKIARYLINKGMLEQPRILEGVATNIGRGHWKNEKGEFVCFS